MTLITIRRNTLTGRYYPFVFREAPFPSDDGTEIVTRYRSRMHHTSGFATLAEAQVGARRLQPKIAASLGPCDLDITEATDDAWQEWELPLVCELRPRSSHAQEASP